MSYADTLPDAVADAIATVIREARAGWERELEVLRAERRALVAELRLAALGQPGTQPEPTPAAPTAAKPKASRS
ncbi:MAG: hypothetical protein J0I54_12740 [Bosea sp.]|uniref:hypothetical protein n=1 Tax=unclassified Bosea (in: a-proteobacteria) TaxID=2653178 RepID=UPI00095E98EE|nr:MULTISPECIES: hypothetical protein [unclassified Bosea (in: a-proteobacteria)]MBN9457488.1 hypothetical protein [Bosea sp. (in: a-proteobacteria)]OJV09549.1 MAG: hypothetical protein BGO20_02390 [Bosea sp. 67-29]